MKDISITKEMTYHTDRIDKEMELVYDKEVAKDIIYYLHGEDDIYIYISYRSPVSDKIISFRYDKLQEIIRRMKTNR